MPVELGVWRIDRELERVGITSLDQEKRLEDFLDQDISIASPNWMVIGRQVPTDYGKFIDLLAIDRDGKLIVLELKKNMTPREVVAQLLDYGSWVRELEDADIAAIYAKYCEQHHPEWSNTSLDEAFHGRFQVKEMPEELNTGHELVVVASELDDSTERIVSYLAEEYGVDINAIFFRIFKDEDREYLSSVWFIDPIEEEPSPKARRKKKEEWNGEYYVSFGNYDRQNWEDARKYSFVSGCGGSWYTKTLGMLSPGDRVWVNIPGSGYVGVGIVTKPVVNVEEFMVTKKGGKSVPITELPVEAPKMFDSTGKDEGKAPRLVAVEWLKTVPLDGAIKEKGFFGNQNTVCKPTARSWQHTVDRLKKRFGVE